MEDNSIKYTQYSPVDGYSIEDLEKLLYKQDPEMQKANIENLGKIVQDTENIINLPIQYLNSLDFLPGEKVDVDKYKDEINSLLEDGWDDEKSPNILNRFIQNFGSVVGPNGDIGKAVYRSDMHKAWMNDKSNQEAFANSTKEEVDAAKAKNIEDLLKAGTISEMYNIATSNKFIGSPDFATIFSDDNMKSILGRSDFDTLFPDYIQRDSIGLPPKYAAAVINGIAKEDASINAWIEQYNRLFGTTYTLDNCIDSKGNVKEDLPQKLRGALQDAFARATATSRTITPYSISSDKGKKDNGDGDDEDWKENDMEMKTLSVHLPSPVTSSAVSLMANMEGSEHYIDYFKDRMLSAPVDPSFPNMPLPSSADNSIFQTDWDSLLELERKGKDGNGSPIYDLSDINFRKLIDDKIEASTYNQEKNETSFLISYIDTNNQKKYKVVAKLKGKVGNGSLAHYIQTMYRTMNTVSKENTQAISDFRFKYYGSPVDASTLDKNDFSMVMQNTDGVFCVDSDMKNVKNIDKILAVNYGTSLGPIAFVAQVTLNDDKKENVILKVKRGIDEKAKFAYKHLSKKEKISETGLGFMLNNLEYGRLCYVLESSWLQEHDGTYYKEVEINNKLCNSLGLTYIPVNFYGTRIRMTQKKIGDNEYQQAYFFVDDKGNRIGSYVATNLSDLINRLVVYSNTYENIRDIRSGDNLREYCLRRCTGLKDNDDVMTERDKEIFLFFPGYDENYDRGVKNKIDSDLMTVIKMLDNNGKNLNNTDYVATDSNNYMIQRDPTKGEDICAGDVVKLEGSDDYGIIIPYKNGFVVVDKNFNFKAIADNKLIQNINNKFYRGKYRGQKIV